MRQRMWIAADHRGCWWRFAAQMETADAEVEHASQHLVEFARVGARRTERTQPFMIPPAPGIQARRTSERPKTSCTTPTWPGMAPMRNCPGAGVPAGGAGMLVNRAIRGSARS